MSLPYFPLYADDFEADTAHLTLEEDGAYNRLLRLCWRTPGCSLPNDRPWIYRKMRARTDAEKAVVDVVLEEFFTVSGGRVSNARLTLEWTTANEAHERRKNAGAKGGKAKALANKGKLPSNALAIAKQPEPEPEPVKKERTKVLSQKGTRLPEDWALPREWGEWAVSEGWPEVAIREEASKFRDYWISKSGKDATKRDWLATWRNWMRNSKTPKGGADAPRKTDRLRSVITAAAAGTSREDWPQSAGRSEPVLDGGRTGRGAGDGSGKLDGPSSKPDASGNQDGVAVLPARPREPDGDWRATQARPGAAGADCSGEAPEAHAGRVIYATGWR